MAIGTSPLGAITPGGVGQVPSAGGGVLIDPSRPNLPGWRWLTQGSTGPLAGFALAGGGAADRPAAGGLVAFPDADSGNVRIDTWWSGAPFLKIMRLVDGHDPMPVRAAFPLAVRTATRTNRCTTPSLEAGTTGWLAGPNSTMNAVTDPAAQAGTKIGRLTATAAGTVSTSVPVKLSLSAPMRIALGLRLSAAPTGNLSFTATWVDLFGVTSTTSVGIPAAALAGYVDSTLGRTPVLLLPLPTAAADLSLIHI